MAAYNKFQVFVQDIGQKIHNLNTDTLTVALCAAANAPVATNTVIANLTQIAYTNLSSRTLTGTGWTHTTGTATGAAADLVLTASGAVATFRYVVIYNFTAAAGNLICWYDHGSDVTLANGETYTIDFTGGWATLA